MAFSALLLLLVLTPVAELADVPPTSRPSNAGNSSGYSLLTTEDMLALPLAERTVPAALRLCLERSAASQFCAWLRIDTRTELVLGGACFDESRQPCNKIGYTKSKNTKTRYRYFTCNGCSSCASQRDACADGNCTVLCYCSCGHSYTSERGLLFDASGSDWHFAYPCEGVCDSKPQCPYGEDEHSHICAGVREAENDWSGRRLSDFTSTSEFYVMLLVGGLLLLYIGFEFLNRQHRWVPWLIEIPRAPRHSGAQVALVVQAAQQQNH